MKNPLPKKEQGPGVPEAVPRTVQHLFARFGAEAIDRLWVFPPMINGRRERGLVTASRVSADEHDERRILVTATYFGERTGKGLTFEISIDDQGIAPPDRFPRVMEGVVRRAGEELGDAREIEIDGDPEAFAALFEEFGHALLDPELPPLKVEEPEGADAEEADRAGGEQDPQGAGEATEGATAEGGEADAEPASQEMERAAVAEVGAAESREETPK